MWQSLDLGFRKIPVLTKDGTPRESARLQPMPTLESLSGSETTHQVMAATVACPAGVNRAAHIAVPSESQLTGTPALKRLGAQGLFSPRGPNPFLLCFSALDRHCTLERSAQTPEDFLPTPPLESCVSDGETEALRVDQLLG